MSCRYPLLSLCTLLGLLGGPGVARAHRLEAQAFVRPFGVVQVESWYETGESPKGARLEVFGPDGMPVAEGKLDANGVFTFRYAGAGPLRVVVSAPGGHRAETTVPHGELVGGIVAGWFAGAVPAPTTPYVTATFFWEPGGGPLPTPAPTVERPSGPQTGRLLLGVALLAALAGGALLLKKARHRPGPPSE